MQNSKLLNPQNAACNTWSTLQVLKSSENLWQSQCIYFVLFATKLLSCGLPQQPISPADIQSGHVIMVNALISWPGYTWTLCASATDSPPGGLGSTRWLIEQLYTYMSPSLFVPLFSLSWYKPCQCLAKLPHSLSPLSTKFCVVT